MASETITQWLDADEVRALAESLMLPGPRREEIATGGVYGSSFEGFGPAPSDSSFTERKTMAPPTRKKLGRKEVAAPLRAKPKPAAETKESVIGNRIEALGKWLDQQIPGQHHFVAIGKEEPLVDRVRSPKILRVARTLAAASKVFDEETGELEPRHIQIAPELFLSILGNRAGGDLAILGIAIPGPLSSAAAHAVGRAFATSLNRSAASALSQ